MDKGIKEFQDSELPVYFFSTPESLDFESAEKFRELIVHVESDEGKEPSKRFSPQITKEYEFFEEKS